MSLISLSLLSFLSFADGGSCPVGNLKACQEYLKKENAVSQNEAFAEKYNEVCTANVTFSCVKITVRDNVETVMKEQAEKRGPKAALYKLKIENEDYIYVLAPKSK